MAAQIGLEANGTCACPRVADGDAVEDIGDLVVGAWNASFPLDVPFRAVGVHVVLSGRFWVGNTTAGSLTLARLVHCDGHAGAVFLAGDGTDATAGAVHAWWHWPTQAVDNERWRCGHMLPISNGGCSCAMERMETQRG